MDSVSAPPVASRAGAQRREHGIVWSVAASCRNQSGKPTLAASDHVRWLNNAERAPDEDADVAGRPPQQSTMGKKLLINLQF